DASVTEGRWTNVGPAPLTYSALPLRLEVRQIGRQRRVEGQPLAGDGVRELQMGGVQELARRPGRLRPAIGGVTHHGVPHARQVPTNLVRAAGFESQLQQ